MRHASLFPFVLALACASGKDASDTDTDAAPVDDTDDTTDGSDDEPSDDETVDDTDDAPTDESDEDDTDPPVEGVQVVDGATRWLDGSSATSCLVYRDGDDDHVGVGTGAGLSGAYWIDPDGSGGTAAVKALCEQEADGGGWTMVLQGVPSTGTHTCTGDAVGTLEDGLTVSATAKLSDVVIQAAWASGTERKVRTATEDGTTATTRSNWTRTCVLDFVSTTSWDSTASGDFVFEGDVICTDGVWADPSQLQDEGLCGYRAVGDFTPLGSPDGENRYFILSSDNTLSGGTCTNSNAGRGWAGSSANSGCNVTKVWVR